MYLPKAFARDDRPLLVSLMRRHSFATVIGVFDGALPEIAHLPLLIKEEPLRICGHVAKQNPLARLVEAGAPLTAIFHGPHAYVSPRYYVTAPNVPTWNYVVVHATGPARAIETLPHVRELTASFEAGAAAPWTPDETYAARLAPAVVAFELTVETLAGKLKLNQNRKPEDWAAVVERFSASGDPAEREMAALMRSLGPPR